MNVRSAYDEWHRRVFDAAPNNDDGRSPWYALVREALGRAEGLRVLEVACGRCGFVSELAGKGALVTGCDFSGAALAVGRRRLRATAVCGEGAGLVQADVEHLPFAECSYDAVVSCETIEHVPDPFAALRELYRVARLALVSTSRRRTT